MSAHIIQKSISISTSPEKVWQLLVNPKLISEWASAFSEGTYVESDFHDGSSVVWKTKDGERGAVGKVTERKDEKMLEISYYDELNPDFNSPPGAYKETFTLSNAKENTILSIKAGPLADEHFKAHEPLWINALDKLKAFAEQVMSIKGMDP
jgi:uncharacterized protein YndB with AHSA1/START domain